MLGYNADGTINWSKAPKVSGFTISSLSHIVANSENELVITGASQSAFRFSVQCFSSSGDSIWARLLSHASASVKDLKQAPDGGYIIAVNFNEYGMKLVSLVKTDSFGRVYTLGRMETPEKNKLMFYPNPASNQVSFTTEKFVPANISIIDLQGRICKISPMTGLRTTLVTDDLAPGIYLYKYQTTNSVLSGKLIISH